MVHILVKHIYHFPRCMFDPIHLVLTEKNGQNIHRKIYYVLLDMLKFTLYIFSLISHSH